MRFGLILKLYHTLHGDRMTYIRSDKQYTYNADEHQRFFLRRKYILEKTTCKSLIYNPTRNPIHKYRFGDERVKHNMIVCIYYKNHDVDDFLK